MLLPTGDVSSYRLPSESGGFLCFPNSFQGPSQGSFQFPLCDDSSVLAGSFQNLTHIQASPSPVVQFPGNILAAMHLPALPSLPGFGQWCLFFRDMKSIPCTPGTCNAFSGIFTASALAMAFLGKASPKMMIDILCFGMWWDSPGLELRETWAVFDLFSFSVSLADWTLNS